jgi:hypothetical protein
MAMASTRALLVTGTVVIMILATGVRAAANEDGTEDDLLAEPAPATGCCCNPCGSPQRYVDPERRSAQALGWTFFGVGSAISVAHSFTAARSADRIADLIPVAGPIAGVWHSDEAPAWTAALLFAAWSQAVGILVLGLVASDSDGVPDPALTSSTKPQRNYGFALSF